MATCRRLWAILRRPLAPPGSQWSPRPLQLQRAAPRPPQLLRSGQAPEGVRETMPIVFVLPMTGSMASLTERRMIPAVHRRGEAPSANAASI